MSVSDAYREWVLEQLRVFGPVTTRRMFGALGLYADGLFFGIVDDDTLYLKVDERTRDAYEAAGMPPFQPTADMKSMSYYAVPPDVLESPDQLAEWATEALEAARRKKKG